MNAKAAASKWANEAPCPPVCPTSGCMECAFLAGVAWQKKHAKTEVRAIKLLRCKKCRIRCFTVFNDLCYDCRVKNWRRIEKRKAKKQGAKG